MRTVLHDALARSRRLAPRSAALYRRGLDAFVGFAGPGPWTGAHVEAFRDALAARGLRPASVNAYLAGVRYASRRLADLGLGPDFARAAELQRIDWAPRAVLTLSQARALVAACQGREPRDLRDRALILIGLRAGLRRAEIVGLGFDDVAPEALRVRRKGGRVETVPLDDEAGAALRAWSGWLARRGIRTGPVFRAVSPRPALEGGAWGVGARALTADGFRRALAARAARAGLRGVHPHALRHTFVTLALQAGQPLARVALLASHRDPKTTMRYAHLAGWHEVAPDAGPKGALPPLL